MPNAQLVKEGAEIASIYKNKSVAEQNSIGTWTFASLSFFSLFLTLFFVVYALLDIAWELLMDPSFEELRHTIYATGEEKRRFRQVRRLISPRFGLKVSQPL